MAVVATVAIGRARVWPNRLLKNTLTVPSRRPAGYARDVRVREKTTDICQLRARMV
jgi:hypothetical protein